MSSAVAEERTATATSASPPASCFVGRDGSPAASGSGIGRVVEQLARGSTRRLKGGGVLDIDVVQQLGQPLAQPGLARRTSAYAGAPITKPSGTGSPAEVSSPRFAPLPPA